jgi:hypothetical protein
LFIVAKDLLQANNALKKLDEKSTFLKLSTVETTTVPKEIEKPIEGKI